MPTQLYLLLVLSSPCPPVPLSHAHVLSYLCSDPAGLPVALSIRAHSSSPPHSCTHSATFCSQPIAFSSPVHSDVSAPAQRFSSSHYPVFSHLVFSLTLSQLTAQLCSAPARPPPSSPVGSCAIFCLHSAVSTCYHCVCPT